MCCSNIFDTLWGGTLSSGRNLNQSETEYYNIITDTITNTNINTNTTMSINNDNNSNNNNNINNNGELDSYSTFLTMLKCV